MSFENKVVIVTGGSRGIGFATVQAFLNEGATVALFASRKETADKAIAEIHAQDPNAKVAGFYPNLADYDEVERTINAIGEKYGHIDVLVNNAGISDMTPFTNYTEAQFNKVIDLNIKGVFNCANAAAKWMVKQHSGVILNISSMVAITGQASGVAYPTSKFAVNGFTVSLARELGPQGVRVNAVAPGITETDMMKAVPQEVIKPLIAQIPLRRLGQPEDIANALIFLASDKASYITGVILSVDGMARS